MAEKNKKTITGQVLNSIKINKLKCINGLNEIIFKPHALTAILGPNGSGKSTILHAIASIYMPEEGFPGEDHRLMHFFPRSPHAEWNGSDFIVNLTYRKDGVMIENELKNYGKADIRGSRWIQIYARRPLREVYYLGIDKCVPIIESENEKKTALDKVFTGTESRTYELKAAAEGKVKQFNLPNGVKPEQYIHYLITNVPLDGLGGEYLEIIEAARDIRVELDAHNYISNILTKLGIDRPSGLTRVMDLASRHPEWHQYVSEVTDWLQPVVSDLMERLPENDTVDIT
ncbi:ATP-binding protein [Escherichia coli]|nr:ATP-binding protein [Escherichia coli]